MEIDVHLVRMNREDYAKYLNGNHDTAETRLEWAFDRIST